MESAPTSNALESPANNIKPNVDENILGPSLLDVMQTTRLSSLKATYYSRSAVVARVHESLVGQDCSKRVQEFFVSTLQKLECDASGLVLVQDSSVCVILESTSDQFTDLCSELRSFSVLIDVKVLATCDDNATRLMKSLYFKKLSIAKPVDDADEFQLAKDVVFNLVTLMRRFGAMPASTIKKTLAAPSNSDLMLMPSNDTVVFLAKHESLMSLDEFLDIYKAPISIELESERVWPIHPLFTY
ncbi:hypothetical protein DYB30_000222 [Aphanomyces astaci]|uniref:Uncharacterized protein n=2 Tax=Aphanomyces astaci TaxID=112090 RepID=A0A397BTL9_APHAT|nr:hypothetical protein AaE_005620 [Aphanomyces astaci]RHY23858.1 hypothetical protein DYB36_012377 [Aphanomyces astaci]RHY69734.1 hypothetical protein DYB30_000222 [Aphanomyces astaci]RHZ42167.1 hypothetical protein DYB26_001677 [Aphanomyces astaci]